MNERNKLDMETNENRSLVLIVDDEESWRNLLIAILEEQFLVISARSYKEALKKIQGYSPSVVISDIRLVDDKVNTAGVELARFARRHGAEIILITGYPSFETVKRAFRDLDVYDYIRKYPEGGFKPGDLREITSAAASSSRNRKKASRVLIVEDNEQWQSLLADILSRDGYQVDIVTSREEMFQNLSSNEYGLTIVDLNLGLLDLTDILQSIRSDLPTMTIFVVTGYADEDIVIKSFNKYKVSAFFTKQNFDPEEFRFSVERAFMEITERYVVAWIENIAPGGPLSLGHEYRLFVKIQRDRSTHSQHDYASFTVHPGRQPRRLSLRLFAEEVDIQPSYYQSFVFYVNELPPPIIYRISPTKIGDLKLRLDLYLENDWLINLKLSSHRVID